MDLCWKLIMRNLTFLFPISFISNSFLCYHKTEWGRLPCMYFTCVPITGQANLQDKINNLQEKVDKLDTFQNTTEANTRKNHHKVVELLQNMSCSLDGKTITVQFIWIALHTPIILRDWRTAGKHYRRPAGPAANLEWNGYLHPIPPSFMQWDSGAEPTQPTWILQDQRYKWCSLLCHDYTW